MVKKDSSSKTPDAADLIGKYAAFQALAEISLGSLLHALNVPMTGHLLSINQSIILSRCIKESRLYRASGFRIGSFIGFKVSTVVSILKSISPAGRKIGPMLAISAQGFLFSLGTFILGFNRFGAALGGALLSVWSYVQLALSYYILYGKISIEVIDYILKKSKLWFGLEAESVVYVLIILVLTKLVAAAFLSFYFYCMPETKFENFLGRLHLKKMKFRVPSVTEEPQKLKLAFVGAWKDLLNVYFIISFILMMAFVWFIEKDHSQFVYYFLRPLAIGFIVFFIIRLVSFKKITGFLNKVGFKNLSSAIQISLNLISSSSKHEKKNGEQE